MRVWLPCRVGVHTASSAGHAWLVSGTTRASIVSGPYGTFRIDMNTHLDLEPPGQDAEAA